MDDARTSIFLILKAIAVGLTRLGAILMLLVAGRLARADVSYISPNEITALAARFDAGHAKDVSKIVGRAWTCDLYGVRSKLQVQRDLKLYDFRATDGAPLVQSFVNSGDAPVTNYTVRNDSLEGHGAKETLDQVRLAEDGRLISRLSVPSRGGTVAYAVCTGS